MAIPKIIHFIWIGPREIPSYAIKNVSLFAELNPDHRIIIHNDDRDLFPSLKDKWDQCTDPAQRSDLLRYSILLKYGGWYFDVDFFPFRPIDDMVRGLQLDGSKCFVSRQQGHTGGKESPFANTPLACCENDPAIANIIDKASIKTLTNRTSVGPELFREEVSRNPHLFHIGSAGWFFPLSIQDTPSACSRLYSGQKNQLRLSGPSTGGHLPIAAHLWAGAVDVERFSNTPCKKQAIVQTTVKEQGLNYVAASLEKLGYDVVRTNKPTIGSIIPSLMVCWNGLREKSWSDMSTQYGIPLFRMEHGFFNRSEYRQFDIRGILHHSSWAHDFGKSIPVGAYNRLRKHIEHPIEVTARQSGNILILGQLDGDSQLIGSEVQGSAVLNRAVSRALADGMKAVFRPHPLMTSIRHTHPNIIVENMQRDNEGRDYRNNMQSSSLREALSNARFVISINSNSMVEATMMGIPCLAFGPGLGLNAGVYRKARLSTLKEDIQAMLAGWCPEPLAAVKYLALLAEHQYNSEELQDPVFVESLLNRAGVIV